MNSENDPGSHFSQGKSASTPRESCHQFYLVMFSYRIKTWAETKDQSKMLICSRGDWSAEIGK